MKGSNFLKNGINQMGLLPLIGTTNVIKIIVLEINSTLKGIRKHHNDFPGVDQ